MIDYVTKWDDVNCRLYILPIYVAKYMMIWQVHYDKLLDSL